MATISGKLRLIAGENLPLLRIVAINLAIFLLLWIAEGIGFFAGTRLDLTHWLTLENAPGAFLREPWTLLTFMFTQVSLLPLIFNMLWLWWFGRMLSITLPGIYSVWLYLFGGLAGALMFLLTGLIPQFAGSSLAGASASVLCIMTAVAVKMPNYEVPLLLFGPVKIKWIALISIIFVLLGLSGGNAGGELAHLGGVLAGAIYAIALRRGTDLLKWTRGISLPAKKPAPPRRFRKKAIKAMRPAPSDRERLDHLLDKINAAGYGSLTKAEQNELSLLSKRINNTSKS